MDSQDQTAIRAAYHGTKLLTWMIENPQQPIPIDLLRPTMEYFADYIADRFLIEILERAGLMKQLPKPACEADHKTDHPSENED